VHSDEWGDIVQNVFIKRQVFNMRDNEKYLAVL